MSEILPRVAEVERLVDEREVGNDVADHRMLDRGPILPGRTMRTASAHAALRRNFDCHDHRHHAKAEQKAEEQLTKGGDNNAQALQGGRGVAPHQPAHTNHPQQRGKDLLDPQA